MGAMAPPSGTFLGHLLPGLALLAWGILWLVELVRAKGRRNEGEGLEVGPVLPWLKILALFVGGIPEIPGRGWSAMSFVMGWHHITMYMAFAFSGVVDLLRRKGLLGYRATYYAFAGASLNAGLLFYGHGNHGGLESTAHLFIALLFALCAVFALLEVGFPQGGFHWFRMGSMMSLGAWFMVTGWLLFRSGWVLADPDRVAWVYPLFAWTVLAVAALLVAVASRLSSTSSSRSELS